MTTTKTRMYVPLQKAAGNDGFFITTNDVDHDGDRIFPEGGDLKAYLANPVVLWLHDAYGNTASAGIPVATTRGLKVIPGKGIRATGIDWLSGDEFADRVKNAWDQDKIRAASVGFIPLEYEPNEHGGHDIKRWRLLEWSLVPIPANPQAVRIGADGKALAVALKAAGAPDLDWRLFEPPAAKPERIAAAIRGAFENVVLRAAIERAVAEAAGHGRAR